MDDVSIATGFRDDERPRAAELYWSAFARKLSPAFRHHHDGLRVLTATIRPDRVLTARVDGELVGVCGFHHDGHGAVDMTWRGLRSNLTRWDAARAALVLAPLDRHGGADTLVLDGICVADEHRGLGIGTALLDAASDHAHVLGHRAVQLSVIDSNPRAARLYERRGFHTTDRGRLGTLGILYGFDGYRTMRRDLHAREGR